MSVAAAVAVAALGKELGGVACVETRTCSA
jgi:hypothetical protein